MDLPDRIRSRSESFNNCYDYFWRFYMWKTRSSHETGLQHRRELSRKLPIFQIRLLIANDFQLNSSTNKSYFRFSLLYGNSTNRNRLFYLFLAAYQRNSQCKFYLKFELSWSEFSLQENHQYVLPMMILLGISSVCALLLIFIVKPTTIIESFLGTVLNINFFAIIYLLYKKFRKKSEYVLIFPIGWIC